MARTSAAARLRSLIRDGSGAAAAGCFDALSAVLADRAGFDLLHVTGFGVEATMLAGPDMGLVTLTELSNLIDRIATVVDKPIICDVDSGFGEIENIHRTVRAMDAPAQRPCTSRILVHRSAIPSSMAASCFPGPKRKVASAAPAKPAPIPTSLSSPGPTPTRFRSMS
jgi:methylisocitrate lyase